ncbi:GntR family transcriptional regulator [Halobacillus halophilus]|uniref:GntR family transcriptional regulator n=1 Tax=Halobacillus halophilus TaxID=1570 RepID=UPI001CD5EDC5|nr:GntR family transcriptional regulator [Halobacillus halophilus]MCA1010714.1 GntR family transcriptional regulator [Halobacillus halophilus]
MPLNYVNSVPLHIQLKQIIEQNILNGVYYQQIPSEREFIEEFNVSRSTVREAINLLVREGILEKRHGKGTFISLKPIDDWLGNLSSTSETIERMGMEPGAKLINSEFMQLNERLQILTGLEEAYHFKRLRFANHIPIGVEYHYYPLVIGNKISSFDLNHETLYDLLEKELGIKTFEAEQVIRSGLISTDDAKLLNVPASTSMLKTERKLLDINGEFVELEHAFYRADMYSFKINLSRKNN